MANKCDQLGGGGGILHQRFKNIMQSGAFEFDVYFLKIDFLI